MYSVEVYLAVRRFIFLEGHSRKEAARVFGLNKSTVASMCARSTPGFRRAVYKKHRIDPFIEIIKGILREDRLAPPRQRHTIQRIFERLKAEHGFRGVYTTVRKYVRKISLDPAATAIPLAHDPGNAQVDFGEALAEIGGSRQTVHLFCMILTHSDAPFVKAYPAQTSAAFLDGHISAFRFFGKVPRSILYDNLKLAVAGIDRSGVRKRTKHFSALVSHYLFEDRFCRIGRGQDKAKVEKLVGYARRNFMTPVPVVDDFEALNTKLEADCISRRHQRVGRNLLIIGERLPFDLNDCRSLPREHLDIGITRSVMHRVRAMSLVRFETNDYSVPTKYIGQDVAIIPHINELVMLVGNQVIARHARSYQRGTVVYNPLHYLTLLEQRPGALEQAAPLQGWRLPPEFARLRAALEARLGEAGKREYIGVLRLLETFEATQVIKEAFRQGLASCEAIKRFVIAGIQRRPIGEGALRRLRKSQKITEQQQLSRYKGGAGVGGEGSAGDNPKKSGRAAIDDGTKRDRRAAHGA